MFVLRSNLCGKCIRFTAAHSILHVIPHFFGFPPNPNSF